jgi:mRNA interferase RelE/StbE
MSYKVVVFPKAQRQIAALPVNIQKRVHELIKSLKDDPRPPGTKKLRGDVNLYRQRIGDYRLIYSVEGRFLVICVLAAGHRKDVYKRLSEKYDREYLLRIIRPDE